jgi:hypothetical protein
VNSGNEQRESVATRTRKSPAQSPKTKRGIYFQKVGLGRFELRASRAGAVAST